jgi:hypothetical protein
MELINELSSELIEIVGGLSLPVRIGWFVFAVWGLVQIVWFRYARTVPTVMPRSTPAVRRTKPSSGVKPIASTRAGSPEFIAALAGEGDERAARLRTNDATTMADASSVRSSYR